MSSLSLSALRFSDRCGIGQYLIAAAMPTLISHLVSAQNPPVLMVNKTSCTIEVYAACGTCPSSVVSTSPSYSIAPHDVLLFSETLGNGCLGDFMYFKIVIPGVIEPLAYEGAFDEDDPDCLEPQTELCMSFGGIVLQSEHPCLASDARIFGEYHANSSAGSNCHIVLTEY